MNPDEIFNVGDTVILNRLPFWVDSLSSRERRSHFPPNHVFTITDTDPLKNGFYNGALILDKLPHPVYYWEIKRIPCALVPLSDTERSEALNILDI